MNYLINPEEMSPEARIAEVAAILAKGFLRLKMQSPDTIKESAGHSDKELDSLALESVTELRS